MGTNCAHLVADLFFFMRDFMLSLSDNNKADVVEVFNSTSGYLDGLLNIDNPYFEQMVSQIYSTELQLDKAHFSDIESPFLDLDLSITNDIVPSKIYDKRDDFNFAIVIFVHFLMEMFLALLSMVYTFYNLFVLREYVLTLMTSTTETLF